MERNRTYHWQDPMDGAKKAMTMSGLDYLNAMSDGSIALPPILNTMGFDPPTWEDGKASFAFTPQEYHYNPIGCVHGGVISTILDSAMGCTLHLALEVGTAYTTLELKVNFLKAITVKTGRLVAIGKIINQGSRTALVEARLEDASGTLYAYGVSTCMIMKQQ